MLKLFCLSFLIAAGCTTARDGLQTLQAGDGKTFTHEFRSGVPRGAENAHASTFIGLMTADGKSSWTLQLTFKKGFEKNVKSIAVYDVSTKPKVLVTDKEPQFDGKIWMHIKETDPTWLAEEGDSFFIFKFVITSKDGKKEILYQPQNFEESNKDNIRAMIEAMADRNK